MPTDENMNRTGIAMDFEDMSATSSESPNESMNLKPAGAQETHDADTAPRAPRLPVPAAPSIEIAQVVSPEQERETSERVQEIMRGAQDFSGDPKASVLWLEAAELFHTVLRKPRDAAHCYQMAHVEDPSSHTPLQGAQRLFRELGQWAMVILLLDKELEIGGENQAPRIFEKGWLQETRLGEREKAEASYLAAWESDKGYTPALEALCQMYQRGQDFEKLAATLFEALPDVKEGQQKIDYLVWLARIYDHGLAQYENAIRSYEEAASLVPGRTDILLCLYRLYQRTNKPLRLAKVLLELAEKVKQPTESVRFMLERAKVLTANEDLKGALESLRRAQTKQVNMNLVSEQIIDVLERLGRWDELIAEYQDFARREERPLKSAILLYDAATVALEKITDKSMAMDLYKASALMEPTYQPAIESWGKICAKEERWKDLVEVFDTQLTVIADSENRVPILFKLSEVLSDRLGDNERAAAALREILEHRPAYGPALKSLSQLYSRQGNFHELIGIFESELEGPIDSDQAIFLLEKIASIYENQIGDIPKSIDAFKRMFEWRAGYLPALRSLGRLYAKEKDWTALVNVNLEEARGVGDQTQMVALYTRNGEILSEELNDVDGAVNALQQALILQPTYLPALRLLGRIFASQNRWHDLIQMHEQEAEVTQTSSRQASLMYQVAMIYTEKIGDHTRAQDILMDLLNEQAGYQPALRALHQLSKVTGDLAPILRVYEQQIAILEPSQERSNVRCKLGQRLSDVPERIPDAIAQWELALRETPGHLQAMEHLVNQYALMGDLEKEIAVREMLSAALSDEASKTANLTQLTELYKYVDSPGVSRQLTASLEELTQLIPGNLRPLYERIRHAIFLKDYALVVDLCTELAGKLEMPADIVALHEQIIRFKEGHLDPPLSALENHLTILEYKPEHTTSLLAVERSYWKESAWDCLIALYEHQLNWCQDRKRQAELCFKLGDVIVTYADDSVRARSYFERALAYRDDHLPSVNRLVHIYEKAGDTPNKLRMLSLEAKSSKDVEKAVATMAQIAQTQDEELGDEQASMETRYLAFQMQPTNEALFKILDVYFTKNGMWDRLADVLVANVNVSVNVESSLERRLRCARLLHENLPRTGEAIHMYRSILNDRADHQETLRELGQVYLDCGQWDEALASFHNLAQYGTDLQSIAYAHLSLGVIYSEQKIDNEKAIGHLSQSIQNNPKAFEARHRLATVLSQSGQVDEALEVTDRLIREAPTFDAETRFFPEVEAHVLRGRILEGPKNEPGQAAESFLNAAKASTQAANKKSLLVRSVQLFTDAGRIPDVIIVREMLVSLLMAKEPEQAAQYLVDNALTQIKTPSQLDDAVDSATRALQLNPRNLEVRSSIARILAKDVRRTTQSIETYLSVVHSDMTRFPDLRALHTLWSESRNYDRAFVSAELLHTFGSADAAVSRFLEAHQENLGSEAGEALDADEIERLLVHPKQRGVVHEILAALSGEVGKLFSKDIPAYQVERRDVHSKRSQHPMRQLADALAQTLGGVTFELWMPNETLPVPVKTFHGNPSIVVLSPEFETSFSPQAQKFLLGRALMRIRCGLSIVDDMSSAEVLSVLNAVGVSMDKSFRPLRGLALDEGLAKKVYSSLSRQTRRYLTEPVEQLAIERDRLAIDEFLAFTDLTCARAGLLLSGNFEESLHALLRVENAEWASVEDLVNVAARNDTAQHLFQYALNDDFYLSRQRIRVAVDV